MRILSYLIVLIVVLLGVTFAALNHNVVSINYYLGESSLPLSLLLAISFIFGSLLALIVGFWLLLKLKLKHYRLQQKINVYEKEIENLRAIPLQDKY